MGAILNAIFLMFDKLQVHWLINSVNDTFLSTQSQEDPSIGPVVLDLVVTVQAYVMKASNSISLDKPLVTENIRKYGQSLK